MKIKSFVLFGLIQNVEVLANRSLMMDENTNKNQCINAERTHFPPAVREMWYWLAVWFSLRDAFQLMGALYTRDNYEGKSVERPTIFVPAPLSIGTSPCYYYNVEKWCFTLQKKIFLDQKSVDFSDVYSSLKGNWFMGVKRTCLLF